MEEVETLEEGGTPLESDGGGGNPGRGWNTPGKPRERWKPWKKVEHPWKALVFVRFLNGGRLHYADILHPSSHWLSPSGGAEDTEMDDCIYSTIELTSGIHISTPPFRGPVEYM
jgi:hypothetical protein